MAIDIGFSSNCIIIIFKHFKLTIMALPKYTDPAVQNQTQDEAMEHIDNLHSQPVTPGKTNTSENRTPTATDSSKDKIKSYKEGNKKDILSEDDNMDYDDIENDFDEDDGEENESAFYGRGL
jgi:hypothetical protein